MRWWSKLIVIIFVAVVGLSFIFGMWNMRDVKKQTRKIINKTRSTVNEAAGIKPNVAGSSRAAEQCRSRLKMIEMAKRKYAQDTGLVSGTVKWEDIISYLPKNTELSCPSGGRYSLNSLGEVCTCTIGANKTGDLLDDHIIQNF